MLDIDTVAGTVDAPSSLGRFVSVEPSDGLSHFAVFLFLSMSLNQSQTTLPSALGAAKIKAQSDLGWMKPSALVEGCSGPAGAVRPNLRSTLRKTYPTLLLPVIVLAPGPLVP